MERFFTWLRAVRAATSVPLIHRCPEPPQMELMAVLARIGPFNLHEQRRCPACRVITHWRRDHAREAFRQWTTALNAAPIHADMSDRALPLSE